MSVTKISTKNPHFDGLHYDNWTELIENLLCANGLSSLVKTSFEEPNEGIVLIDAQMENTKRNDHNVKHYPFLSH